MTTRVRLVLFDLDNTLCDHSYARNCCLGMVQARFRSLADIPLEVLAREYDVSLVKLHKEVLKGTVRPEEARRARLEGFLDARGVKLGREAIDELLQRWSETYHENERAVPGAVELLEALRDEGLTIGVLTNHMTRVQERKLKGCGLAGKVGFMLTSEAAGCAKPDPRIFEMALERAGARPEETVMVGDLWESDIIGARAAGIRSVWFNRDGLPAPEAGAAEELRAFEPVERAVEVILGR